MAKIYLKRVPSVRGCRECYFYKEGKTCEMIKNKLRKKYSIEKTLCILPERIFIEVKP